MSLRFISVMMGCMAAVCVTLTSCNDDDDDVRGLTPQEQQAAYEQVKGSYTGTMYYAVKDSTTGKAKTDSTTVSWEISSDSTMTVRNFPVSLIANYISDTTLSKPLSMAGNQDLRCYLGFIRVTPSTFLINPISPELNLTYGGTSHKIQIPFYVNTYYSYGELSGSRLSMQIVAGGIYSDGKDTGLLNQGIPFAFVSKK